MKANLSITLNQDYPSNAPPTYSLFAPFLSNTNRSGFILVFYMHNYDLLHFYVKYFWKEF